MNNNAEFAFFSKWLKSPRSVASVTPSSSQLAKAMASALPEKEGLVIELGGGTGPITHALLQAGVAHDRLIVVEHDPHFYRHLLQRFPDIDVLCDDALQMASTIEQRYRGIPTRAIVSGLPLLSMSAATQKTLLQQAMLLTRGEAPIIQFSYGLASPLKKTVEQELGLTSRCIAQVWQNIPPAKVWVYE